MGADLESATDFFDAIFGDLFGLGRKKAAGQDLRYTLELDFTEAAIGCEKNIRFTRQEDCQACSGTGAEGGTAGLVGCTKCAGKGFTRQKTGFFSTRRECLACGGAGEVPRVALPDLRRHGPGRAGQGLRGAGAARLGGGQRAAGGGRGLARPPGRPAGDLYVNVRVRPHEFYREEAGVLVCELPVSPTEAALGAEVEVPLLVADRIPQHGRLGDLFERGVGLVQVGVGVLGRLGWATSTPARPADVVGRPRQVLE